MIIPTTLYLLRRRGWARIVGGVRRRDTSTAREKFIMPRAISVSSRKISIIALEMRQSRGVLGSLGRGRNESLHYRRRRRRSEEEEEEEEGLEGAAHLMRKKSSVERASGRRRQARRP